MKKLTTAFAAAALSASLLSVPAAQAADSSGSGSALQAFSSASSQKDNADKIPDGWETPKEPPLGSAYTGFAPISVGLGFAALAVLAGAILKLPQVQQAIQDFTKNLQF
ncbi:hypothetical protein KBP53_00060 [Corynebacterium genitalium ATCC 33030]|uniref:Secreted protein n=1 Tax=Corynebacterium genitalium ATCC 33030 TaxID=585529 RepID=D7WBT5_9CORY|nr:MULTISPECIES: hypothetical protein [Corynebacterium]EFK55316.1 hypothetical protein HMPREF0291_10574 [Corynebacterium genitalium ATCC 33030]MCQ4620042.1 hypothetical protein [Corynebacterium sp. CCUG 71335]MCQ4623005.1 hypothetical protein [Corynebacterium sp. CCUG 70398]MCQ4624378.1 hypothetical protein [Corynebacterium sp. CCUG 69979]MCQ4626902.1 hypothetical protein [Corynebacterium sp. CCUG 65737]